MKTTYFILLNLLVALQAFGNPISVEEFNKMSPMERKQAILQAPPDQREELKKVDTHLTLLQKWNGETGLKMEKESRVACARGLCYMESVFVIYTQIWDDYVGGVLQANEKAGMTYDKQAEAEAKLNTERDAVIKLFLRVHSFVFNMAASSESLEMEKKMEQLSGDLTKKYRSVGSTYYRPITRDEVMLVKKQMDQIFEQMKSLPTLPSDEVQKEYSAYPDDKLIR